MHFGNDLCLYHLGLAVLSPPILLISTVALGEHSVG